MKISVEVEGLQETLAAFKGVEQGMLDLRQLGAWKAVASEFRKIVKEQFNSEGGVGRSGKWKPLKLKYAAMKSKKYGDQKILQASGKLYRSLTTNAERNFVQEDKQELRIGTSVPYATYHQTGTKNMPARLPIDFTDEQGRQLMKPIQDKLKQLVANAKLRGLRGF